MKRYRRVCLLLGLCVLMLLRFGCRAEARPLFGSIPILLEQELMLSPHSEEHKNEQYTAAYTSFDESAYRRFMAFFLDNGFEITSWRGSGQSVSVALSREEAFAQLEFDGKAETAVFTCSLPLTNQVLHCTVDVNSSVLFGSYEQDNDLSNGPEKIEWIVLERDSGSALLISRCALDSQVYVQAGLNDVPSAYVAYWEGSYMRQWLNDDFLHAIFDEEELSCLILSRVSDDPNPYFDTPPGNDTWDQIWLPSVAEMEKYFPDKISRIAYATDYAFAQRHITYQAMANCGLRNAGSSAGSHAYVNIYGSLYDVRRNDMYTAVRPMIRVRITSQ